MFGHQKQCSIREKFQTEKTNKLEGLGMDELIMAIKELKEKISMGCDGIGIDIIKRLPESCKKLLLKF